MTLPFQRTPLDAEILTAFQIVNFGFGYKYGLRVYSHRVLSFSENNMVSFRPISFQSKRPIFSGIHFQIILI